MMSGDDDYVYDDETGEWIPAGDLRAKQADAAKAAEVVVRDSQGNILADGDQVTLIKDLDVKGAGAGRLIAAGTAELMIETAPAPAPEAPEAPAAPAAAPAGRGRAKAKS